MDVQDESVKALQFEKAHSKDKPAKGQAAKRVQESNCLMLAELNHPDTVSDGGGKVALNPR